MGFPSPYAYSALLERCLSDRTFVVGSQVHQAVLQVICRRTLRPLLDHLDHLDLPAGESPIIYSEISFHVTDPIRYSYGPPGGPPPPPGASTYPGGPQGFPSPSGPSHFPSPHGTPGHYAPPSGSPLPPGQPSGPPGGYGPPSGPPPGGYSSPSGPPPIPPRTSGPPAIPPRMDQGSYAPPRTFITFITLCHRYQTILQPGRLLVLQPNNRDMDQHLKHRITLLSSHSFSILNVLERKRLFVYVHIIAGLCPLYF
jgi:hypothetical protein